MNTTKTVIMAMIIMFAMIGMTAADKPGQPDSVKWTPPSTFQTYDNLTDAPLGPLAARYDRDNDGTLDLREIQIVYHDWLHSRLTPDEEAAFIAILGEEPIPVGNLGSNKCAKVVEVCEVCQPLPDMEKPTYHDGPYSGHWFTGNFENSVPHSTDTEKLILRCSNVRVIIRNDNIVRVWFYKDSYNNAIYIPCASNPEIIDDGIYNEVIPYAECDD